MGDILEHHGVKGMKWGVLRTPEQLGHVPNKAKSDESSRQFGGLKLGSEGAAKKTADKSIWKSSSMSDEELSQRISRLDMEEKYDNLIARQKQRNTGMVKRLLGEAAENLGKRALGVAVDKFIDKIGGKPDKKDIDYWKYADVNEMDFEINQKVAKWYENANNIVKGQKKFGGGSS